MKKILLRLSFPALLAFNPYSAQACAVCFGAKGDPVVNAAGFSILLLGAFILSILGGIIAFMITLARRARRYEQQQQEGEAEWGDVPQLES